MLQIGSKKSIINNEKTFLPKNKISCGVICFFTIEFVFRKLIKNMQQRWLIVRTVLYYAFYTRSLAFIVKNYDIEELEDSLDNFYLPSNQASSILSRVRRSNDGLFEEWGSDPNLERECVEERCSFEEANEIFDDRDKVQAFMTKKKKTCHQPGACDKKGTRVCKQEWGKHTCKCKTGFKGDKCELERDYAKR